jgi:hypothetical protein
VASLFFDSTGWLLAIAGVVLLRRTVFQPRLKWILAGLALAPKILFTGVRLITAQAELAFVIEPRTLANSPALWSWSILLAAVGIVILTVPIEGSNRQEFPPAEPARSSSPSPLIRLVGLVPLAVAALMLLGLTDDFQRIEDAGEGRWALKHALRGTVATFRSADVASVEGVATSGRKSVQYSVTIKLTNGRTYSASTQSSDSFVDLRKFAVTADLRPGAVHLHPYFGSDWTNGSGFTLKDCLGSYERSDARLGERSTIEFWVENGRLAGKETVVDQRSKHVQALRAIKISDTGEADFRESPYFAAQETGKSTFSFSLSWSAQAETARFTKDGLEIGTRKYRKL